MAVSVVSEDMPFPLTTESTPWLHWTLPLSKPFLPQVLDWLMVRLPMQLQRHPSMLPVLQLRELAEIVSLSTIIFTSVKSFMQQWLLTGTWYIHCVRAQICFSCLRLDSDVKHKDMAQWQEDHQVDYNLDWICTEDNCAAQQEIGQCHVMLCAKHATGNKKHKAQLVTECDLPAGMLLFSSVQLNMQMGERLEVLTGGNVHQDVYMPSVFMLHKLTICGQHVLIFYDSGCQTACILYKQAWPWCA